MYGTFCPFHNLRSALGYLRIRDYRIYIKDEKLFRTTKKGRKFTEMYYELDSMVPKENMLTLHPSVSSLPKYSGASRSM